MSFCVEFHRRKPDNHTLINTLTTSIAFQSAAFSSNKPCAMLAQAAQNKYFSLQRGSSPWGLFSNFSRTYSCLAHCSSEFLDTAFWNAHNSLPDTRVYCAPVPFAAQAIPLAVGFCSGESGATRKGATLARFTYVRYDFVRLRVVDVPCVTNILTASGNSMSSPQGIFRAPWRDAR